MAIAIKGANAVVTYLNQPTHLPKGAYYISNIAYGQFVGPRSDDRSEKQPIINFSRPKTVSPKFMRFDLYIY